jgi:Kinesin motor domain
MLLWPAARCAAPSRSAGSEQAAASHPHADAGLLDAWWPATDGGGGDLGRLQMRGLTPRVFEHLFARIEAEVEASSRSGVQTKHVIRCSFLEIYNETITDLLNPSAHHLLIREDIKKGVYVEGLSQEEVFNGPWKRRSSDTHARGERLQWSRVLWSSGAVSCRTQSCLGAFRTWPCISRAAQLAPQDLVQADRQTDSHVPRRLTRPPLPAVQSPTWRRCLRAAQPTARWARPR